LLTQSSISKHFIIIQVLGKLGDSMSVEQMSWHQKLEWVIWRKERGGSIMKLSKLPCLWPEEHLAKNHLGKNVFGRKRIWPKTFDKKAFGPKIIWPKIIWSKKLLTKKTFCRQTSGQLIIWRADTASVTKFCHLGYI
jgi:hypothetical protein